MIAYAKSSLNISGCQWLVGKEHIKDIVASCRLRVHQDLHKPLVCHEIEKFITKR